MVCARGVLSGEAGPGSVFVAGRPPNPKLEHVLSGWDLRFGLGLDDTWVFTRLEMARARRVPAGSAW